MFETIAYAAPAANAAAQQPNPLISFLPMIILIAVFWFILVRPQRKKEKELKNMIAALKVGDEVATVGGIHGKIVKVKEDLFVIESGAGVNKSTLTVDKGSVARYLKRGSEKDAEALEIPEETEE